ncbi:MULTISPECIES: gluconate 2-dehydrogenase subunit 3 family protein [unclassified Haladaptatus]|uniref:gluconate 2-dehydrogenase subunit 3 family protein n=1 Tax=unclassified Haladaptatus TaxID=2622732 RepID=UPI0023E81C69|nr:MULTISPECIES: gluconate 2-dehydrogenase subunit 3 family protein [unclassified Haladaptatus]
MELTRRDAIAALAGVGLAAGGGAALLASGDEELDTSLEESTETMVAVAEILYPSGVTGIEEFVKTYAMGRVADREAYRDELERACADLNETAMAWYDAQFAELDMETRIALLTEMGIPEAEASNDPKETTARRLRYYVWNELQYALYTSPTGGKLVGIENPQGYPGGLTYAEHP